MECRKANENDVSNILHIIHQAKAYFKNNRIDQWQNGYPNMEIVQRDIQCGYAYILTTGNRVVGTIAISFDGEKTYRRIRDGAWITDGPYAVIHRIAIDDRFKGAGFASVFIHYFEKMCVEKGIHSIRVDTHKENLSMQRLLQKNGFQYCGIINLEDGNERNAYEKVF